MKFLFAFRQRKTAEPFVELIGILRGRGHDVCVTLQERDEKADRLFGRIGGVRCLVLPAGRRDVWQGSVDLARSARDYLQYLEAPYRDARKLRRRAFDRLTRHLLPAGVSTSERAADVALELDQDAVERLKRLADLVEESVPTDAIHDRFITSVEPDAVLVSPLVHFGTAQTELVKSARRLGVPVGMLLFSWDNLSTKGALHVRPDRVFVWNERQRQEIVELHGVAESSVSVTGASRFDDFFRRHTKVDRSAFCEALGLEPSAPTLLYLCSSKRVSEHELGFIREWVKAVRAAGDPLVREANIVVRPHPDVPLRDRKWMSEPTAARWQGLEQVEVRWSRLFGDPRVVLVATGEGQQTLYEELHNSEAVVGLNTSAEIEAGIVGRQVFTVLAPEGLADDQHSSLHFHYLLESNGGFVKLATSLDEHLQQLGDHLRHGLDPGELRRRVEAFVRPAGWSVPAAVVLAGAIEKLPEARRQPLSTLDAPRQPSVADASRGAAASGAHEMARVGDTEIEELSYGGVRICVLASRDRGTAPARSLDDPALGWLGEATRPGEVIFDCRPNLGLLAVAAVKALGCTVFAFEPSLPSIHRLWQHVVLNGCEGAVIPIPLAPTGRAVLQQERYESLEPGASYHGLRRLAWREHGPGQSAAVIQPVLAVPLDWVVATWSLPAPHACRLALDGTGWTLLDGATQTLRSTGLRCVITTASADRCADSTAVFQQYGFTLCGEQTGSGEATGRLVWQRFVRG